MKILRKIKKAIKYLIIGSLCLFLINWSSALIKCELLTITHYDEFKDAYKENTMLGDMEYFKVLSYSPYRTHWLAQVYYVGKEHSHGSVLTFKYNVETDKWEEIIWECIWSDSGSASEVIWPYLWHFIYGGL